LSDISHMPDKYDFKEGAKEFPLMVVASMAYICNARCPHCPYTNSDIRSDYADAPFMSREIFRKLADECGKYKSFIRLSGGGEPLLNPEMIELIEYAKLAGARIGLITNGSLLTPERVDRLLACNTDAIEVSVDAADPETYAKVRAGLDFARLMKNIDYTLKRRNDLKSESKVVVSVVNQKAVENQLQDIVKFWNAMVDNVIVRKYLTWNILNEEGSGDPTPYLAQRIPCPWPFERINVDTRGRVMFCGYDIAGVTDLGNIMETSIKEIWNGPEMQSRRELLLEGKYEDIEVCRKCPDWRYRSWNYNYYHMYSVAEKTREERAGRIAGLDDDSIKYVTGDE